jgi:predicted DNA-binding transcriptional regulator AlpA
MNMQAKLAQRALALKRRESQSQETGPWLSKDEIAADLGLHPNSITRMVREGRFPQPVRVSGTFIRWPDNEYQAWKRLQIQARDHKLGQLEPTPAPAPREREIA